MIIRRVPRTDGDGGVSDHRIESDVLDPANEREQGVHLMPMLSPSFFVTKTSVNWQSLRVENASDSDCTCRFERR